MTDRLDPLQDAGPLCRLGAVELASAYAAKTVSPVEVAQACLDRAETVQQRFNAFTLIDHGTALAAARASEARWHAGRPLGPADGVPTTIKDIVLVAGWGVRYGTTTLPPVTAEADSPAVRLLRDAGAVLMGLTTTPEFGWKAVTDSAATGITRNPIDPSLTSGGSSGGAAAAAACGAGVFHLGTDGGGSIRIPAAFCGVVGHKPTFGRVPAHPISAFGTLAHLGPIARTAADAEVMLAAMSGRDTRDWFQPPGSWPVENDFPGWPGLRVGIWRTPPHGAVDPAIASAFEVAVASLADAGAALEEVQLPGADLHATFQTLWFAGAASRLRAVPADRLAAVDPGLREVAELGAAIPLTAYLDAVMRRAEFGAAMDALLTRHDLLVSPAVAVPPFAAGAEVPPGSGLARWTGWAGFSYPINLSQQPACVVPAGSASLQFVSARGYDFLALQTAAAWTALSR